MNYVTCNRSRGWDTKDSDDMASINNSYYLYINLWYRTFSPMYLSKGEYTSVILLLYNGRIDSTIVSDKGGVL